MVLKGCYTAIVTPMKRNQTIDYEGLKRLIEFQIKGGVKGILIMGTTGESPTFNWKDHERIIKKADEYIDGKTLTIAGTGSNSTKEAFQGTRFASELGVKAALLVDPYYNGPSSLEIRREYVEPLAHQFPEMEFIPYVIPGRTGTQLLPQDLAVLHSTLSNLNTVKEATGDLKNMALTRKLCGNNFSILSGDDDKTYEMMVSQEIRADGVISVVSNFVPEATQQMVQELINKNTQKALEIAKALDPLFKTVTVRTEENTPYGPRTVRARNPLPCKTIMNILGMPAGSCRQPIGKMTEAGLNIVLEAVRKVYTENSWVLKPVESFFQVDLKERLYKKKYWKGLCYA